MFLTPSDFEIHNGELVKPNDKGYSFVFFFTNDCKWCDDIKQPFNDLSKIIRGVNFSYMDVSQNNWELMDLSFRTRTPIKYVPLLLLFANGRQVAQFLQDENNPDNNGWMMQDFIEKNTQKFQGNNGMGPSAIIPPYTTGIPGNLASRKICKLYVNAYPKNR
jgi:thiol-disulfide isomerase/thioredoxin